MSKTAIQLALVAVTLAAPQTAGAATIRGRVLAADSGMPVPRALIRPRSGDLHEPRLVSTDAQGRYEIAGLRPGRYDLLVTRSGYLTMAYGQKRAFGPGQSIELGQNDVLERVDFSLVRAGVITGRVTDDFGDAVTDARVTLHRYEFVAGLRRLSPIGGSAQTNDLGEFRLFGLPPGEYYLSASTTYSPSYYPGTVNPGDAQPVMLGAGQELTGLTLPLIPSHTVRITGVALDADRRPLVGGLVSAMRWQGAALGGTAAGQVHADGSFAVTGLVPGEYFIKVSRSLPSSEAQEFMSVPVTIDGTDLDGLSLVAERPVTLRGRILFEIASQGSGEALAVADVRLDTLRALPEETLVIGSVGARIHADWSFDVTAPTGPTIIRLGRSLDGWQLAAVRLNGQDVTDDGFDLQEGSADGIEVVITNRLSAVSGTVLDGRNQPAREGSVLIFPQDPHQWHFQSRYLARRPIDQASAFSAVGLSPGEYFALAVDDTDLEPGEETDPRLLERASTRATRFSLAAGEVKTLDLRLQSLP
jgi:hypothetical protein